MNRSAWSAVAPLIVLLLSACAPAAPSGTGGSSPATAAPNRTLNIIMRVEPPDMMAGAVDRSAIHKPLFTGILGGWDINAAPYPVLAQAVPQLNTDSWKVFPDGR